MLSSYRFSLMWLIVFTAVILGKAHAREIALTFDDAPTPDSSWLTGHERTEKIIAALKENGVEHALFFVKADYINDDTAKRLKQYTEAGFQLAHHSFSHQSAEAIGVDAYMDDFEKAEQALKPFDNKLALHRFPYLRYGKNLDDINQLQQKIAARGYQDGYVTIDNFDWYISSLITNALAEHGKIDLAKARDFYVNTLYDTIEFYDTIAQKTLNRSPRHVLLLHENDAAALFLGDLIKHLQSKGWRIISAEKAYQDPINATFPQIDFHQQGRIAAIAALHGSDRKALRHVSENEDYLNQLFKTSKIIVSD